MDSALTVQCRVIFALTRQHFVNAHSTSKLGYLWTLFDTVWLITFFYVIINIYI